MEILDPRVRAPSKDQRIIDKSLTAPHRANFDEFIKEMGKTLWCRGCKYASPEAVHSKCCMECRQKYEPNKRRQIEQQQQSQRQPYPTVQSASVSSTAGGALTQSSTSFAYLVKPVRDVTLSLQPQQKPGKKAECLEVWSNIPDLFIIFFRKT